MAEKVPVRAGGDCHRRSFAIDIEGHGEAAGRAREGHGAARGGIERERMPARFERQHQPVTPALIDYCGLEAPVLPARAKK